MALVWRLAPPLLFGGRRAGRLLERNVMVYRRTWMVIFTGFFEPLFYLLSAGFGIGGLVGQVVGPAGTPVDYAMFVAPALLAVAAMNGGIYESTMNVFFKLNYAKTYDAILSTPLSVGDVALGEILWALVRGTLYAVGFIVVMFALGLATSPLAILALPASMLVSFAFAAIGMAATTFMRKWQDLDLVQLAILPLFLFSATFYPLSVYPPVLQAIVQLTPLYHGAHLIRGLTLGVIDTGMIVDVLYLVVMCLAGLVVVNRRLEKLLLK